MAAPVVIVGATGAIGSAIAQRVAARGEPLHLVGRDAAKLAALGAALGATTAVADAMDGAALAAAIRAAGPAIGGLAYCVGSIVMKPLRRVTDADYLDAFRLNAMGAAQSVAAAVSAWSSSTATCAAALAC